MEQQKVVVNGQCDLYMDSDSRKFIGQVCVVQKQCKNGKYLVVKIQGNEFPLTYKVFASFYGGYLNGNSWKLNSGITKVREDGNCYLFEGHSGSTYVCTKGSYGTHLYGSGVLDDIIKRSQEANVNVEILPEDTNWLDLS